MLLTRSRRVASSTDSAVTLAGRALLRRIIGGIAAALGIALIAVGFLANPYVYDSLSKAPLDQRPSISESGKQDCAAEKNDCYSSRSEGTGMQVMRVWADANKISHYDKLTDAHVQSTRTVIGIPGQIPKGQEETTAVWQTGVKSEAVGEGPLTYSMEVVTFDRRTAQSTGSSLDVRSAGDLDDQSKLEPVVHEGLFFKFPFDVQKQKYQFWDGDLGKAAPAEFVREENLFGTDTYVFRQTIPRTEVATRRNLPAEVFDGTGDQVDGKVFYSNTRTLWVEPNTGVIIKGQEVIDKSLESVLGTVYMTKGTIGYNEKTVKDNAEVWGSKGRLLGFIRDGLRPTGLIVGGLLLVGGLALIFVRPRREEPARGIDGLGRVGSRREGAGV